MSNAASPTCPQCGKALPANSPGGLCPNCLMAVNLATQTQLGCGTAGQSAAYSGALPAPEEIAKHFPNFEILEALGRGGMGIVYKARQKSLNRLVALKILAPERERDPNFALRFALEAKTLARLNHPGVVTIYDFGQTDGLFYLVMEFVDGVTLRCLLDAARVAPREALAIVPQICDALQYAHDQGIVHRDIKPENILLDRRGRVKVADFGLAKLIGSAAEPAGAAGAPGPTSLTVTAKIMGTPNYMAPEQMDHPSDVDHRADIYALGVVFYQMLTGHLPGEQLHPPSKTVRIDVRLDQVVLQAMEQDPDRRYQQASDVKTAIESITSTPHPAIEAGAQSDGRGERPSNGPSPVRESSAKLTGDEVSTGLRQSPFQRTWLYAFAAGILAVLLLEFAVSALINGGFVALALGLPASGVALIIFLVGPKQWLGGFLSCLAFAFDVWLAVTAILMGPWWLALAASVVAPALLFWIIRRCYLPRGFLPAFLTAHLLVFGASALVTAIMPESYVSMARLEIQRNSAPASPQGITPRVSGFYDPYFIQTEFEVIQSQPVLGAVIQDLDLQRKWGQRYGRGRALTLPEALEFLKHRLDLRPIRNSNLIEIRVFSESADEAAAIANKIAEAYRAFELQSNSLRGASDSTVTVEIVDTARPGLRPVRPNKPLNLTLGALAGLLLGTIAGNANSRRCSRRSA